MGHKRSDFLNRAFPFYTFRYMSFLALVLNCFEYRQFSTTRGQVAGKVHAIWRGPFCACCVVWSLGGNLKQWQVRTVTRHFYFNNEKTNTFQLF